MIFGCEPEAFIDSYSDCFDFSLLIPDVRRNHLVEFLYVYPPSHFRHN